MRVLKKTLVTGMGLALFTGSIMAADLDKEVSQFEKDWQEYQQLSSQVDSFSMRLQMIMGSNPQAAQFFKIYQKVLSQREGMEPGIYESRYKLVEAFEKLGEKRDRKQNLLYARLLGQLGDTPAQLKIFKDLQAKKALEGKDALSYIKALQGQNMIEESIAVAENALKAKADQDTLTSIKVAKGQAYFWLQDFTKAKETLSKVNASHPGVSSTVSRLMGAIGKTEKAYKQELEYQKKDKDLPEVLIQTSKGDVKLVLYEDDAPNAVANFIDLVGKKYYDGQKFHRVIPNFMAQGGDPNSKDDDPSNDGSGGPGYTIKTETSKRMHFRGVISYANAGKDTDGSQFFLTTVPTFWLDGKHAVFGRITEGQSVVDSLMKGDEIKNMKVLKKRKHEYKVVKGPNK